MGPLTGIRIVELAGLGPTPFTAMLLGDLGADVVRIDRPSGSGLFGLDRAMCRNRRSIGLDLKKPEAVKILLDLVGEADVLIEGLRPGVAERLGFGPDVCLERNRRLIYGRMTGWGQTGPLRDRAGHDINYIAVSGALGAIGDRDGKPVPPLNLVGDFGGGSLYLVMGVLAALIERQSSGQGQVIDAAMVDGSSSLMTLIYAMKGLGIWEGEPGDNLLDGGAPFYDTYKTSDGGWMAVGAIEPHFFAELLGGLGIDDFAIADQYDKQQWGLLRKRLSDAFATRTRDEWVDRLNGTDACAWPVLSLDEAPTHPFNAERDVYLLEGDATQPAPAPRFSRSGLGPPRRAPEPGADTEGILGSLGHDAEAIAELYRSGTVF